MRELKLYPPNARGQSVVAWYEPNIRKRQRKTFAHRMQAELFYQEKEQGHPIDKDDLILKEFSEFRKYVARGRLPELEAENAELRAKLESLKPGASNTPTGSIRLFSVELAKELGVTAAVVFQQLCWLHKNPDLGKILDDGQKYIFNAYREWQEKHFPFWSVPTLERAFALLEKQKRIASKQPDGRESRRKYYRPLPESINLMGSGTICENGIHQIEPSKASIWELPLKTKRERGTLLMLENSKLMSCPQQQQQQMFRT
jgi:hypothetical protein